MALFNWSSAFETGHPVIDSQHRHWVDLLNQLGHAVGIEQQHTICAELLQQFIDYTDYHFATEERLMAAAGYADQESHQRGHRQFAERIGQARADTLKRSEGSELLAFLVSWLSEHILTRDRDMVASLLGRERSAAENLSAQQLLHALQESESRFRLAADSTPMPLWLCDTEGRRSYFNRAWLTQTGRPEAEQLALGWQASLHPDDQAPYLQQYAAALDEQTPFEAIYRLRGGDESYRWISEKSAPRRLNGGDFVGLIGTATDITALKQAEQLQRTLNQQLQLQVEERTQALSARNRELQETQQQLVQSEKMAAIGQLAAGVAHEINNPIGYVKSNVNSLDGYIRSLVTLLNHYAKLEPALANAPGYPALQAEKSQVDPAFILEDIQDLVAETQEGLGRVKHIVEDLKDFARVDSAEWQLADLHRCLDSTLNVASNELKYKADVVRSYGEIPPVECMPHALGQVFMNLLVNAAQAMDQRGTITLRTAAENGSVRIEIEDTGSGIAEELHNKIFDPFFTTKPVGSGTGLGLSISYGIIEKHGGSLAVRSEPGQGTCFTILLPIEQPETTPA